MFVDEISLAVTFIAVSVLRAWAESFARFFAA